MSAASKNGHAPGADIPDDEFGRPEQPEEDWFAAPMDWPVPDPKVYHGLAGRIVQCIEPVTEADPIGILVCLLIGFASAVGRGPYTMLDGARHGLNEFAILCGPSSTGRKGTAWARAKNALAKMDDVWAAERLVTGIKTGEALIDVVRDPSERVNDQGLAVDAGVADKRLLWVESEFGGLLTVINRDHNTLSARTRDAWDGIPMASTTKANPVQANTHHISIIGQVTPDELRNKLKANEQANGFINRFLIVLVRKTKDLPDGDGMPSYGPLINELKEALRFARQQTVDDIKLGEIGRVVWHDMYKTFNRDYVGALANIISRGAPHVRRLAMIYALLDRSPVVNSDHLLAAEALYNYCRLSAEYVFGSGTGDAMADELLARLRAHKELTRSEIRDIWDRNKKKEDIDRAVQLLIAMNYAELGKREGTSKPFIILRLKEQAREEARA